MVMMTFMMCSTIRMVIAAVPDFLDEINRLVQFRGIETGRGFIQKDELRFRGQRSGNLQPFSPGDGKALCRLVFLAQKVAETQHPVSLLFRFFDGVDPAEGRSGHIVQHTHPGQGFHHLERAADAQMADLVRLEAFDTPAFEKDISCGDREEIVDAVEDGRLARTVRADEAEDLPFFHLESDIVHGQEPSKGFHQFFQF